MNNGEILKDARRRARITQKEAAELLHVSKRALEDWESGRRNPKHGYQYYAECILAFGNLTSAGRQSYLEGNWDIDDILFTHKRSEAERLSKWGQYPDVFQANWKRIPDSVYNRLTAEELAALVDSIKAAYDDGVDHGRNADC